MLAVALGAGAIIAAGPAVRTLVADRHPIAAVAAQVAPATVHPPKSWKLTFNSSFTGNKLNKATWATCYWWASHGGCTNYGNGNEREWYKASQVQVQKGVLHLIAVRKPTKGVNKKGAPKVYACRSGMVTTLPGFNFKYGYVQVVVHVPFGKGLWPALWLSATNKRWPPEIDMVEHWGTDANGRAYLHPVHVPRQGGSIRTPNLARGWHTFTLYWTKSRLTWYYDGHQVMTTTKGIPQQAMFFTANLAVYNATSGGCSGTMLIKSVKVWQPRK
jgi:beta-glucanase (GH16 family)